MFAGNASPRYHSNRLTPRAGRGMLPRSKYFALAKTRASQNVRGGVCRVTASA